MRTLGTLCLSLLLAAALLVVSSGTVASAAAATPLNRNLVRDSSAEQADAAGLDGYTVIPIPGWTTTSNMTAAEYGQNGCPTDEQAAEIGGGSYFFYGGPDNARSTARQDVRLVGRASAIDQGQIKVRLSAWLGGYAAQGDNARLVVQFRAADGTLLGSAQTANVSASYSVLVHKTRFKLVPAGTRLLRVVLVSIRAEGSYNDGMFDKIDVRLISA